MLRDVLYCFSPYLGTVLMFVFIGQILPLRVSFRKMVILLLPVLGGGIFKVIVGNETLIGQINELVVASVMVFICPLILLEGTRWKKILYAAFFYALQMLADGICYVIFTTSFGPSVANWTAVRAGVYISTVWSIYIAVCSGFLLLIRSVKMQKFHQFYLLFLFVPVTQVGCLYCVTHQIGNAVWFSAVALGIGVELVLLEYTITHEEKKKLEVELQQLRFRSAQEQVHYRSLERRQEELARIRHDFNNQLTAISWLIRNGQHDDAWQMTTRLADDINNEKTEN